MTESSQQWFDRFMAKRGSRGRIRREAGIPSARDTADCKQCADSGVAPGITSEDLAAARKGLCLRCHTNPVKVVRKKRATSADARPFGTCCLCSIGPVARGDSDTAGRARRVKLCMRCYCSGGAGKLKELRETC